VSEEWSMLESWAFSVKTKEGREGNDNEDNHYYAQESFNDPLSSTEMGTSKTSPAQTTQDE